MSSDAAQIIAQAIAAFDAVVGAHEAYAGSPLSSFESDEARQYDTGYRDALSAVHQLIGYGDRSTLDGYVKAAESVAAGIREALNEPDQPSVAGDGGSWE